MKGKMHWIFIKLKNLKKIPKEKSKSLKTFNFLLKTKLRETIFSSFLLIRYRTEINKIQSLPKIQVITISDEHDSEKIIEAPTFTNDHYKQIDKSIIFNQV